MTTKILKQCVGIDCSKDNNEVCFGHLTKELDVVYKATASFPNNEKGFKALVEWVKKLADESLKVHVVIEATGVYHEHLANFLVDEHYLVSVVLPNKVNKYANTLPWRTQNDKTAAKVLCSMGLEKKLDLWHKPDPVFVHLKQLTRERERLQKECTASKNQLHAQEYSAYKNDATIKRAKARITFLKAQIKEIEKEIQQVVNNHPELKNKISKICKIPGVGLITAVIVIAETNGFHYVLSRKQLASYAGYDVQEKTSGTSVHKKPRISKKGNSHIRKAMHFPALSAIHSVQYHHPLKDVFQRIVAKHPDIPMKAYVAIQRKILLLMYTLWKKEEEYIPDYEEKKKSTANKEAIAAKENTEQTQPESPTEKGEKTSIIVEEKNVLSNIVSKKEMTMKKNSEELANTPSPKKSRAAINICPTRAGS
jgi:transposase